MFRTSPTNIVFLLFYLLCNLCCVHGKAQSATEESPYLILVGEADEAIAKKEFDVAATRLIEAMGVEPNNPGNLLLMNNLGMVYSYQDRDTLAIETLDNVIERAPRMSTSYLNRGKVKLKIDDTNGAVDDFNKVIELDSLNYDARYFRGMIALYSGKMQHAEKDLAILEKVQANNARTLLALATLYSFTNRNLDAIRYFEQLIDLDPAAEFYANLAGCYLATENLTEASRVINDGLKLYPRDPELYYYRAWLNRDRFRLDDAKKDAKTAINYGASPQKVRELFLK